MQNTAANATNGLGDLLRRIETRDFTVGIVGMGYVGLPLAMTFAANGFHVTGFDSDPKKVEALVAGRSYIKHITHAQVAEARAGDRLSATAEFDRLGEPDAVLLCVPTPLNRNREPDMTYVEASARALARTLRPGQLVVLESTTYPGTSDELIRPILEAGGLTSGTDFYLAYSPEREDPGNKDFATGKIPKVVGGDGADALKLAQAMYDAIVPQTVPVRDLRTAEAVKLTENIFRSVNIALVNELKQVYGAMDIDVWEVIDAAKTKPFGFMAFYPGPGLGGHCIPIDPFYLTWKAREYDMSTRFIELAGEVNVSMPRQVVTKLGEALNARQRRALNGARILLVGLAYKKNVDDPRESPSFKLLDLLTDKGAEVAYHDPYIPKIPSMREYPQYAGKASVALNAETLAEFDAVLIATDHDEIDYATIADSAALVIDTRNAMAKHGYSNPRIVKA
ncbi:UDP-N-acetyl-D-glucosamine dehydrogenase [Rhodovibrio sodomensis]|uniref:UDP-N-acetyl-D-glucosamine dehydrogenase n=1 Tax=Rhodovibrio sodomensis TaxID=1088 RepID=A0ABS1DJC7_9PROT|nr:nucleotide sugar dehydrogenase [Rhodovibrio sodomensis]MBK1670575.1 UDP-N-acetyl-D-glucosamine dehydrogenase [Rhodovibrio sodomensis]